MLGVWPGQAVKGGGIWRRPCEGPSSVRTAPTALGQVTWKGDRDVVNAVGCWMTYLPSSQDQGEVVEQALLPLENGRQLAARSFMFHLDVMTSGCWEAVRGNSL